MDTKNPDSGFGNTEWLIPGIFMAVTTLIALVALYLFRKHQIETKEIELKDIVSEGEKRDL